jgi:transcriptional regulator with XRE-family HTH domain
MISLEYRIRRARRYAKMTQAQLAEKVGVHRSAAGQWEQPERTKPNMKNMQRIAEFCDVDFNWLATGKGSMRKDAPDTVEALELSEWAMDDTELRALKALRKTSHRTRELLVTMIERLGPND